MTKKETKIIKTKDLTLERAHTVAPSATVIEIAKLLRDNKMRHVHVVGTKGPQGIVSITDINAKVVAEGKDPKKLTAKDIMTTPVHTVKHDEDARCAYYKMVEHGMLSLPVVEKNKVVGVLSINEAMKEMMRQKNC